MVNSVGKYLEFLAQCLDSSIPSCLVGLIIFFSVHRLIARCGTLASALIYGGFLKMALWC